MAASLIPGPPEGYEHVDGPSGPLDLEQAVHAVAYLPTDPLRERLSGADFLEGYARVWERPEDDRHFVVALVLAFSRADGATEALDFLASELDDLRSSVPLEVPRIRGAFGYGLGGSRGGSGEPTFCNLVSFHHGPRVYEVRACGPRQVDPALVMELSAAQARRARS